MHFLSLFHHLFSWWRQRNLGLWLGYFVYSRDENWRKKCL
jgi:hypothetical protein